MWLRLCGTALTDEQAMLLRKYSNQVIFAYDSDGAGQTAIKRGIEVLEKQNCDARVLQMEGAKDPDEYIIKYGSGRFKLLIDHAISLVEFKIKTIKEDYHLENAKDKIAFLKKITAILSKVENTIEREIYIDKVSEQYDISKQALYAEINKELYKGEPEKILAKSIVKPEKDLPLELDEKIVKRENMILYLLINYAEEAKEIIKSNIRIEDLKIAENKTIFNKIMEQEAKESEKIIQIIANIEDERLQKHISEIMVTDYEITSVQKCIEDIVLIYNRERLQDRKLQIVRELENPNLPKEESEKLWLELAELSNTITKLSKIK